MAVRQQSLEVKLAWEGGPPAPGEERVAYEQRALAGSLLAHIAQHLPDDTSPAQIAAEAARVLLTLSVEMGREAAAAAPSETRH